MKKVIMILFYLIEFSLMASDTYPTQQQKKVLTELFKHVMLEVKKTKDNDLPYRPILNGKVFLQKKDESDLELVGLEDEVRVVFKNKEISVTTKNLNNKNQKWSNCFSGTVFSEFLDAMTKYLDKYEYEYLFDENHENYWKFYYSQDQLIIGVKEEFKDPFEEKPVYGSANFSRSTFLGSNNSTSNKSDSFS